MRSGEIVKAKVLDIGTEKIRYKKFNNIEGPNYFIEKYYVEKIVYESGAEDYFEKVELPKERQKGIGISYLQSIFSNNIAEPYSGGAVELSYFVFPKLAIEGGIGSGSEGLFFWAGANIMFRDTRVEMFVPYAGMALVNTQLYNRALYQGFNFPLGMEFIHHKSGVNAGLELSYLNILNDVGYLRAGLKFGYRF